MHTQDIATIDRHGVIENCDRLRDGIKTSGKWVSSVELEGCLKTVLKWRRRLSLAYPT